MITPHVIEALNRLFSDSQVTSIRLNDPRFRWVARRLGSWSNNAHRLKPAISNIVVHGRLTDVDRLNLISHLLEYVEEQRGLSLEDELFSIIVGMLGAQQVGPMLMRLSWDGGPTHTLAEAGEAAGVTRERLRQVQAKLEDRFTKIDVWMPVLDRALELAEASAPIEARALGQLLTRHGITANERFAAHGLINAQRIFRRETSLAITEVTGLQLVVASNSETNAEAVSRIMAIRSATQKRVNSQGIANLSEIAEALAAINVSASLEEIKATLTALPDYVMMGEHWIVDTDLSKANALHYRLERVMDLRW